MHDVIIRDMARDVVKRQSLQEVGERSHLYDFIEAKEVLENNKVNHSIYEKVKVEIFMLVP
jgi:hypothetical protein